LLGPPETGLDKWIVGSGQDVAMVGTSYDPRHPPEAVLEASHNTFWSTTGMFPQALIIGFKEEVKIAEIKTTTRNGESM
jgi:hypothetical protein